MTDDASTSAPPYVSYRTLLSQVERMETEGVPSKIDKHFLVGMAGGTQNHFRHALRTLGLIDEDSRPTSVLYALVDARGEERGKLFGEAMFSRFPELAQLPPNASKSDFFAVLEGYGVKSPDQQRKMLAFYVASADGAGMTVSPHIRPTKGRTGPRKTGTRRRRPAGTDGASPQDTSTAAARSSGDTLSSEAMRGMYFKLLLKKAEQDDGSGDLLDRIERLVGVDSAAGQTRNQGWKTAGSTPATPTSPASQEEG